MLHKNEGDADLQACTKKIINVPCKRNVRVNILHGVDEHITWCGPKILTHFIKITGKTNMRN